MIKDIKAKHPFDYLNNLKNCEYKYVLGHPEQLMCFLGCDELKDYFKFVVVDEAHCLLSWGKSKFHPAFLKLRTFRSFLLTAKFVALTATATKASKKEIAERLLMHHHVEVSSNPDRWVI